MAEPIKMLFGM